MVSSKPLKIGLARPTVTVIHTQCGKYVNSVRRICLGLLREWEGWFRRYADGTDTGECSIKVITRNVLFFVITGVY